MIGKCVMCKTDIEILGTRRFCGPCKSTRNSEKWKIWNDKRPGVDKVQYHCNICKELFFSKAKRKHIICHKNKCQNHFHNLSRQIKSIRQQIKNSQEKLVLAETEYESITGDTK
mgnify:FL=1